MSRLGDVLALETAGLIADYLGNFRYALYAGGILCAVSFTAVVIYGFLDRAAEPYFPDHKTNPADNELNFKSVLRFDARFWLVSFLCLTYYGGVTPFVAICADFLTDKYLDANGNPIYDEKAA